MSPLWGFKMFVCRMFYKHVAPLGLKADAPSFRVIRSIRVICDSDKWDLSPRWG